MEILMKFSHGLGDAVQFGIVLEHLRLYRPEWDVDLTSLRGKHSAFRGLCRRTYHDQEPNPAPQSYHQHFDVKWHEQNKPHHDVPSTKVARCLIDEFGIQPDASLYRYQINVGDTATTKARQYLQTITAGREKHDCRFPVLLLHYQGNTSQDKKDLTHETAFGICQAGIAEGLVPVILDWDRRSPLPDQRTVFCPSVGPEDIWGGFGSGDAEVLAALIAQSSLLVGIDSGPLHVAGATRTRTLAVWTGLFPPQYYDLADNVTHCVPQNWRDIGFARHPEVADYFERNYRFAVYQNLANDLMGAICSDLPQHPRGNLVRCGEFWIRRDNTEQDLVIVRDIYEEDAYRTSLLSDNAGQQVVVDIGAHIGCFAKLWHKKNPQARIICVEACPENLEALRANVGDFAEIVHAACTYETEPVGLLNAVRPNCESTGGSVVVSRSEMETSSLRQQGYKYWTDQRPMPKVTLEDLMRRFGFDHIDVLKLDCEGSEYSILDRTPSLRRVRMIVGEYHGRTRWDNFRMKRFRGWDYGHMYDGGESGGLFHYANPVWPPARTPHDNSTDSFIGKLRNAAMKSDQDLLPLWEPYYRTLFEVAKRLGAKRVVEIGVRAGYSGLAFLTATPEASVYGIDSAADADSSEHLSHAEKTLAGMNYQFTKADSHSLDQLPEADLVFIDGDHSYEGCTADLHLAEKSSDTILIDDYGTNGDVRKAVDDFLVQRHSVFTVEPFEFMTNVGMSMMVLLRRKAQSSHPKRPLMDPPVLRVAVPAGIGDSLWALTKVPAMLRHHEARKAHVALCGGPPHRAKSFVERFDFVESVEYSQWECVEQPPYTREGVYNWAPSGVGWHNEFDWMLQANRHLENGERLETWLPEFETDWAIADRFQFAGREVRLARELEERLGTYCVFYLGPEQENTTCGHNRGPLWKPEDWGQLATHCRLLGLSVVAVGAEYDRSCFKQHVAQHLGNCYDAIGKWPIGQTYAVIQRASFVIAYQSGIGIFAVYMGVPTAMFWRPHGDSVDPHAYVSFDDNMASAWAPRDALASGRYLPLIYTRCSPESIIQHATQHNWHEWSRENKGEPRLHADRP